MGRRVLVRVRGIKAAPSPHKRQIGELVKGEYAHYNALLQEKDYARGSKLRRTGK